MMTITLTVSGQIDNYKEPIIHELEVPDGWKPSFNEFCKVKGALRHLEESLSQNFSPPPALN